MDIKIPVIHDLNNIEKCGATGGIIGAVAITIIAVPATLSFLPFVGLLTSAVAVGSLVGSNGAGKHCSDKWSALGMGMVEGATIAGIMFTKDQHSIDIHGPHAEHCGNCGWSGFNPPGHHCTNPDGIH